MNIIRLEELLDVLNSGDIFQNLRYVSFDKKRKTGGELKTIREGMSTRGHVRGTKTISPSTTQSKSARARNHFEHGTRNVAVCVNGKLTSAVRTVHIVLITEINGKKLVL